MATLFTNRKPSAYADTVAWIIGILRCSEGPELDSKNAWIYILEIFCFIYCGISYIYLSSFSCGSYRSYKLITSRNMVRALSNR
jgi:hypothetical protein